MWPPLPIASTASICAAPTACEAALARYEHLRRGDVGLRTLGVHMMDRMLLADILPADFMRGAGLAALRAIGPLRRALMREGILAGISDEGDRPAQALT